MLCIGCRQHHKLLLGRLSYRTPPSLIAWFKLSIIVGRRVRTVETGWPVLRRHRKEAGRTLAARSGSWVGWQRQAGSAGAAGSQPEAGWELLLSCLISPRI